ncbi:response regulator transcription factor [Ktedonobacter racemifer]|uniref:Two component transcriptional regulator, winged helix family n=1 Tax=Ktedonobacter racemifer DSM 44963 TaxID=485913 RepID=D6TPK4_KTERA|nr:response regulator transcription factor [Ktedonobacter racemifer]EFH85618.1 two component transcriptional regulator, winged helix family [Ktedonobacter racemifer DSM 44963]
MRILLVEDHRRLNHELQMSLVDEGYAVDTAFDGVEGQAFAESTPYDVLILDILLPGKDGLQVCRDLRRQHINTPILLLTARDTVADRVRGLDSGADDYLIKPFALSELLARLRALLRRNGAEKSAVLCVGDLSLDPATHVVKRAGQRIELTPRLFALLEYLMRHPNQILTREMIANHIWSYEFTGTLNAVEVCMRRLRCQVDEAFPIKVLETVRGVGYRLHPPE